MPWKFSNVATAERAYEDLKEKIAKGTANKPSAINLLEQIKTDLPGSWIAQLADELLKDLDDYF